MPPTILLFTITAWSSWASKAAFWAAFTRLSEAFLTALPAAWRRRKHQECFETFMTCVNSLTVLQSSLWVLPYHCFYTLFCSPLGLCMFVIHYIIVLRKHSWRHHWLVKIRYTFFVMVHISKNKTIIWTHRPKSPSQPKVRHFRQSWANSRPNCYLSASYILKHVW